jgi:hypothetical protein
MLMNYTNLYQSISRLRFVIVLVARISRWTGTGESEVISKYAAVSCTISFPEPAILREEREAMG